MTFGSPNWLWALVALPALVFFFARAEQLGAEKLTRFVAARLLPQLAGTVNRSRRIFRFLLLLLVLGLVIVSLARPRWGYAYDEVKRKGLDLLLAVDVSRSMLSNDVQPNRLERVKLATQDLINELQGDRVGLIAFAGRAFLQAPLTIDYDAVVDSINDLDTKTIPEGGTNISDAIGLAIRTFGKSATGNRALIIFTDGEDLSGDAVSAAKAAAEAGVRIFTVGVGTPGGSLIPIQDGNGGTTFVNDAKGEVVKSKLDETRLREVAQAADGFYVHLENGPRTMKQIISEGLAKMQVADINARLSRRPIERYEWPLGAAILLFSLALLINERKGSRTRPVAPIYDRRPAKRPSAKGRKTPQQTSASLAILLFLVVGSSAHAASAGLDLYEQQKFPEAYDHFEKTLQENPGSRQSDRIQFDAGAAAYKMKNYNKALEAFSQALLSKNPHLQSESNYNLGNTLYERGAAEQSDAKKLTNWESALQHYEETLKAEPQNKNAKDNYDYVKRKIEELKKKQEQKPSPTPSPPPPSPSPSPSPSPQKNQNKNQKQQKQQQKNDQQQKQQQQQQQQQQQDGQGSGTGQKSENKQQSPTPTPTPSPTPKRGETPSRTPGESPSPSPTPSESPSPTPGENGAGESPTPSPSAGEHSGTSPTPGEQGTPSPTPGSAGQNGSENGEQPSPSPLGTPGKAPTGEVKGAGEQKPKETPPPQVAEAEPEKEGEMTPKQAAALLQSMKDEEQKVQLDEHKRVRPVYNDW